MKVYWIAFIAMGLWVCDTQADYDRHTPLFFELPRHLVDEAMKSSRSKELDNLIDQTFKDHLGYNSIQGLGVHKDLPVKGHERAYSSNTPPSKYMLCGDQKTGQIKMYVLNDSMESKKNAIQRCITKKEKKDSIEAFYFEGGRVFCSTNGERRTEYLFADPDSI